MNAAARRTGSFRRGFLATESVVALALLAAAVVAVAQLSAWTLAERAKLDARSEAVEAAANVLEAARARPWDDLTPAWAGGVKLPNALRERWPSAKLAVRVEPEAGRPRVKRVTVELRWDGDGPTADRPVTLAALFAARSTGGTP